MTLRVNYICIALSLFNLIEGGLAFHGKPDVITITSSTLTANLDVGISLSVQQEAFDTSNKPIKLSVHPCLTGPFVLPHHYEAASPAYLIEPINGKSPISVTVCLQHHAKLRSERDRENINFLSASPIPENIRGRSVYTFKEMITRTFVEDQVATITHEFSYSRLLIILSMKYKGKQVFHKSSRL